MIRPAVFVYEVKKKWSDISIPKLHHWLQIALLESIQRPNDNNLWLNKNCKYSKPAISLRKGGNNEAAISLCKSNAFIGNCVVFNFRISVRKTSSKKFSDRFGCVVFLETYCWNIWMCVRPNHRKGMTAEHSRQAEHPWKGKLIALNFRRNDKLHITVENWRSLHAVSYHVMRRRSVFITQLRIANFAEIFKEHVVRVIRITCRRFHYQLAWNSKEKDKKKNKLICQSFRVMQGKVLVKQR